MQTQFEKADIISVDVVKKEWSAPVFEIISKEVVQSGGTMGPESHSVAGSH